MAFTLYLWVFLCLFCLAFFLLYTKKRSKISRQLPSVKHRFFDVKGDAKFMYQKNASGTIDSYNARVQQLISAYTKIFRKEGVFCLWISYTPFVFCVKAQTVEELIGGNRMMEKSWPYKWLHPWLGTGLLTSGGSKWKTRRKLLTPSFHFDILKEFLPVFNEQSMCLVHVLKNETQKPWTDIITPIILCTLDIICETTLGVKVSAQKNSESEYVKAVLRTSGAVMERAVKPHFYIDFIFYSSKAGQQFEKDLHLLHEFTRSVIQEKKQKLIDGSADILKSKRKALMDLLLEQHIKNKNLSEEDIREEVDTFAFEGHDTTSMGISWALYLIGLHNDVQVKIQKELDAIFGSDVERHVTMDDLKDMNYLECTLKESLRIFPSVPLFGRQANEEILINGYTIPKGVACAVIPYELHRDPEVFPDPEKFMPDRFLPENATGRHPYAYVPFSAGPRNCIGQRFAMMEEKTVVANILRNYSLHSLEKRDKLVTSLELILRSSHPLKIKITPRAR